MKFSIEVELDWIDEESNIDDQIKRDVVKSITETVSKKLIEEKTAAFQKEIGEKVDVLVNETFSGFMSQEVVQRDTYGDVTNKFTSVREMLKFKLDNYMTEAVNSSTGKRDTGFHSRNDITRFDYIFNTNVTKAVDVLLKKAQQQAEAKIKEVVSQINDTIAAAMKAEIGEKLHQVLELDKLLGAEM